MNDQTPDLDLAEQPLPTAEFVATIACWLGSTCLLLGLLIAGYGTLEGLPDLTSAGGRLLVVGVIGTLSGFVVRIIGSGSEPA